MKIDGKPLIAWLVEAFNGAEGYGPVTIAGPEEVYAALELGAQICDTHGSIGKNLENAIAYHREIYGDTTPMALISCDVMLTSEELSELREHYETIREGNTFWMPFVKKPIDPEELGAFDWKPTYQLCEAKDADPINILPGHTAIFRCDKVDWPLLLRLAELSYETKNLNISTRRSTLARRILFELIQTDFRQLLRLRKPYYTYAILKNGLRLARELKSGKIVVSELADMVREMFHRRDLGEPGTVFFPIVDLLALAEDIDTEEEAAAVQQQRSDS